MIRVPPRAQGRPDDRLHAGAAGARPASSASCTSTTTAACVGFLREADRPAGRCPATPSTALASMGIYVFTTGVDVRAALPGRRPAGASEHDFGKDIIPAMLGRLAGLRLPVPRREPQGGRRTGATSARSTPTTRPTWT